MGRWVLLILLAIAACAPAESRPLATIIPTRDLVSVHAPDPAGSGASCRQWTAAGRLGGGQRTSCTPASSLT